MNKGGIDSPQELCRRAAAQGFTVRPKRKGWMILAPGGQGAVTLHKTPSDHRGMNNAIARLKRLGFDPAKT